MTLPNFIVTGFAGLIGGLLVSVLGIAKNKLQSDDELKFNWSKFLWTVGAYTTAGTIAGLLSANVTEALVAGLAVERTVKIIS